MLKKSAVHYGLSDVLDLLFTSVHFGCLENNTLVDNLNNSNLSYFLLILGRNQ